MLGQRQERRRGSGTPRQSAVSDHQHDVCHQVDCGGPTCPPCPVETIFISDDFNNRSNTSLARASKGVWIAGNAARRERTPKQHDLQTNVIPCWIMTSCGSTKTTLSSACFRYLPRRCVVSIAMPFSLTCCAQVSVQYKWRFTGSGSQTMAVGLTGAACCGQTSQFGSRLTSQQDHSRIPSPQRRTNRSAIKHSSRAETSRTNLRWQV